MEQKEVQRRAAESLFADEIAALQEAEQNEVPEGWNMSPRSVLTYILGGKAGAKVISPKYIGDRRLVEIAVATLLTDRSLLLIGEPGTAKSWLSEHLAAAINGDSGRAGHGRYDRGTDSLLLELRPLNCRGPQRACTREDTHFPRDGRGQDCAL